MNNAVRLPSGNWRVRVSVGKDASGKRLYKSFTCSTRAEAENLASSFKLKEDAKKSKESVMYWLEDYISVKSKTLSPSTVRGYKTVKRCLERNAEEFLLKRITDIDSREMQRLVNVLMAEDLSVKTIKNICGLLSAVFGWAACDMPRYTIPRKDNSDDEPFRFTSADIEILLAEAKDTPLESIIMLGAFCGLRRSEIAPLTMADVSGNTLRINKATVPDENNEMTLKHFTKTKGSTRTVVMPQSLVRLIRRQGFVTAWDHPDHISQNFGRFAARCGYPDARFHLLRHYFASYAHQCGLPDALIQEMGGWSNDIVMKGIYRAAMPEENARLMAKMHKGFDRIAAG